MPLVHDLVQDIDTSLRHTIVRLRNNGMLDHEIAPLVDRLREDALGVLRKAVQDEQALAARDEASD